MKKLLMWGLTAAVLSLLGVCCGASFIAPACFWNEDGLDPIVELRLLRVLAAWVVGGSLALAGMVFQAVLRNPLAEPFTLGLSGGAGVGAALAFVIGLRTCGLFLVPLSAWLGAIAVLALVLLVSRGGARGSNSLLLSGVIAGTIASSLLMYLVSAAQVEELAGLTWWMLGDLQAVDPDLLLLQGAVVVVAAVVLLTASGFRFEQENQSRLNSADLDLAVWLGLIWGALVFGAAWWLGSWSLPAVVAALLLLRCTSYLRG